MNGADSTGHDATVDPNSGLPESEIRSQLGRILASPEFHATDKMRNFLRFVVDEKLAGRSHRLKGYTIAVNVFERCEDFDATRDPIVRIQAGRLRRALERYYLVGGVRDPILIDIPKGGYVPRFTMPSPTPAASEGRSKDQTVTDDRVHQGPSVAVLPFENLTGDADRIVLTAGLTEELVTELTRFQDIAVFACRPERRPPGYPADPIELARFAGARFVLRGAVRRDTEAVKVSAQLTDTIDGRQIWADASTHPADASRLIATQEHIAHDVVRSIASEYGIIARRLSAESRKKPPTELETYEAMLRYYGHQIAPTAESANTCFAALEFAARREPDYGPVWSALATLHCQIYSFDAPGAENALNTALRYARRGVELEPGSQLGRLILAYACHLADDGRAFDEEAETALALNPSSPYAVGSVGYLRSLRGELDRGLPLLDRAIAANPCHPAWFRGPHVIDLLLRNEIETALATTRKYLPFMDFWDEIMQTAMLGLLDRTDEAQPHIEAIRTQKPDLATRAGELMRRSLKIDSLVDDLVDGLRRAGLAAE